MAWRAMTAFGLRCELVKAEEIAQGALLRKPALLLAPGGSAAQKAKNLGGQGIRAIREWLHEGGCYMGFCGGAGLALSGAEPHLSLQICPWRRHAYNSRFYHLISGCLMAKTAAGPMPLPVWWPGRFEPQAGHELEILATYDRPAQDLWLADLPLAAIPAKMRSQWHAAGLLDKNLHFPKDQPLIIAGQHGRGRYVLSYAHLETPASPQANAWLAKLLRDMAGLHPAGSNVPVWDYNAPARAWAGQQTLRDFYENMRKLLRLGCQLGFFVKRLPWLWGWRAGAPGIIYNHLLACLALLQELPPTDAALAYWRENEDVFCAQAEEFCNEAKNFFWSLRLDHALRATAADGLENCDLQALQAHIFGHPMRGGGLAQKLLPVLEELLRLSQK